MLVDRLYVFVKKFRHLFLAQPDGFFFHLYVDGDVAVFGLVEGYLVVVHFFSIEGQGDDKGKRERGKGIYFIISPL